MLTGSLKKTQVICVIWGAKALFPFQLQQADRLGGLCYEMLSIIDKIRDYLLLDKVAALGELRNSFVSGHQFSVIQIMDEARRACVAFRDLDFSPSSIVSSKDLIRVESSMSSMHHSLNSVAVIMGRISNKERDVFIHDGPSILAKDSGESLFNFSSDLNTLAVGVDDLNQSIVSIATGVRLRRKSDYLEKQVLSREVRDLADIKKEIDVLFKSARDSASSAGTAMKTAVSKADNLEKIAERVSSDVNEQRSQIDADIGRIRSRLSDLDAQISDGLRKAEEVKSISESAIKNDSEIKSVIVRLRDADSRFSSLEKSGHDGEIAREAGLKKVADLIDRAEVMLSSATSAGLATAFDNERLEIDGRMKCALISFFVGILILLLLSMLLVAYVMGVESIGPIKFVPAGKYPVIGQVTTNGLISRALVLLAPFWLTWFSARRYMRLFDLRQKYSHKYTMAFSVDGFKKQSPKFEDEIAALVFAHVSDNPVDSKKNAHMAENPLHRLRDTVWEAAALAVGVNRRSDGARDE